MLLLNKILMFDHLSAFWPRGYQRGSLEKSFQHGDDLKQAMEKSCSSRGLKFAVYGLPKVHKRLVKVLAQNRQKKVINS